MSLYSIHGAFITLSFIRRFSTRCFQGVDFLLQLFSSPEDAMSHAHYAFRPSTYIPTPSLLSLAWCSEFYSKHHGNDDPPVNKRVFLIWNVPSGRTNRPLLLATDWLFHSLGPRVSFSRKQGFVLLHPSFFLGVAGFLKHDPGDVKYLTWLNRVRTRGEVFHVSLWTTRIVWYTIEDNLCFSRDSRCVDGFMTDRYERIHKEFVMLRITDPLFERSRIDCTYQWREFARSWLGINQCIWMTRIVDGTFDNDATFGRKLMPGSDADIYSSMRLYPE